MLNLTGTVKIETCLGKNKTLSRWAWLCNTWNDWIFVPCATKTMKNLSKETMKAFYNCCIWSLHCFRNDPKPILGCFICFATGTSNLFGNKQATQFVSILLHGTSAIQSFTEAGNNYTPKGKICSWVFQQVLHKRNLKCKQNNWQTNNNWTWMKWMQ